MSRSYETLLNRLLDATAVVHVPVKLFTILIILWHTPKDMRTFSMFLRAIASDPGVVMKRVTIELLRDDALWKNSYNDHIVFTNANKERRGH
uniref:BCS1_N domain-containing protein n=1 Tax=Steinernema glaseri TaxID=37863 RepID=A0A1I8AEV7_9BILA